MPETRLLTPHTSHQKHDTWNMTVDMWDMVGGEHSLKISAPQLLRFGIDSVLKILNKKMTQWINYDKGVYRIAPATPGLLIRIVASSWILHWIIALDSKNNIL